MTSATDSHRESSDAKKVDSALAAIGDGRFDRAESILLEVIANTPDVYTNVVEGDDGISIKFWDQTAFIHYVTWKERPKHNVQWIGNAYPRAYYHLGFLCVKRKDFNRAIAYLDDGLRLEPTNPKFLFEKAQALVHTRRFEEALALYDQVSEVGAYVSGSDIAVRHRGRGFVLIELGRLDDAEAAFRASLEIEPENGIALNELTYIEHLRCGGRQAPPEAVPSISPDLSTCAVCGGGIENGFVVSFQGTPLSICHKCKNRLTKRWWQFWK